MFDPEFLKAFFGEGPSPQKVMTIHHEDGTTSDRFLSLWEYHARNLVLAKDRIEYLEKFI